MYPLILTVPCRLVVVFEFKNETAWSSVVAILCTVVDYATSTIILQCVAMCQYSVHHQLDPQKQKERSQRADNKKLRGDGAIPQRSSQGGLGQNAVNCIWIMDH